MGSMIEINDTLRISKEQGFPQELDIHTHLATPYTLDSVENQVFHFQSKPKIRVYKAPPVHNFLVEDIDGKWLYWGLCQIIHIEHSYETQETSGSYKIIRINTPTEMQQMFELVHNTDKAEANFFTSNIQ